MSDQVGDMQKELDIVQKVLKGKRNEFDDPYQSEEKRVSIMEDGESLFRDPKSSIGICEGIDDDYADLINQIADGSRNESQISVVNEELDTNDAEEKNPKVSSGKKSTSQSRPSTAMTAATKRTMSQPKTRRKRNLMINKTQSQLIHHAQQNDGSNSSVRSSEGGKKQHKHS